MADIFVSYASEDRVRVAPLVEALQAEGLSVWWDSRISLGTSYDRVIEHELNKAACVLIVWSAASVESDWVREEAQEGLDRNVLVLAQIEECRLPLGFRRTQTAQLTGWPSEQSELATRLAVLMRRTPGRDL